MEVIYYHKYELCFLTLIGIAVFSLRKVKYFTIICLLLILILWYSYILVFEVLWSSEMFLLCFQLNPTSNSVPRPYNPVRPRPAPQYYPQVGKQWASCDTFCRNKRKNCQLHKECLAFFVMHIGVAPFSHCLCMWFIRCIHIVAESAYYLCLIHFCACVSAAITGMDFCEMLYWELNKAAKKIKIWSL